MKIKTFYRDEVLNVQIKNKQFFNKVMPTIDLRDYGIWLEVTAKEFLPTFHSPFKVVEFDNKGERKEFINMLLFYRKQYQENLREAKKSPCYEGHKGNVSHTHNGSGYHTYACDLCNNKWNVDSGD